MIQSQFKTALHPAYFTLFPQSENITERAHGLDISKYDLFFHPENAIAQLDFVVQRISYRTTRDEAFDSLLPGVMKVPIRGGYHYLNSDADWKTQADKFLSYVAPYKYHFFNCDFEDSFNNLSFDFVYDAWNWIQYVQDKTGIPVLLYTSPSLYNAWIAPSQSVLRINWNTIDLWTAQWFFTPNPNGTPSNPTGRTGGWKLWQYTDKGDGTKYGVARPTACDLDVFNGTVEQMRSWLNIGTGTMPPNGDGMKYKVVWPAGVARRSAPSTSNSATSATPYALNQVVDVIQDNILDAVSPNDVNKRWVKFADGLFGASNYPDSDSPEVRMVKVEDNPPTTPVRTHTIDVFSNGSILVDGNAVP